MKHVRFALAVVTIVFLSLVFLTDCSNEDSDYNPYIEWVAEDLGSPGDGWATPTGLAIDPSDNKPVVVYSESLTPRVKKWSSGTTWTDLGSPGGVNFTSIAIDPSDNKPVVAAGEGSCRVYKWSSGTTWTDLGDPSSVWGYYPVIVIDPSDNKPIVAFVDNDSGYKIRVKKWSSGTTWTDLGNPSTGSSMSPQYLDIAMTIDPSDNKPIVVFIDVDNNQKAHVKKWSSGTTWTDMGFLSDSTALATKSIVIDPSDNKPIAGVVEGPSGPNENLHILKWSSGTSWIDMGYPVYCIESAGGFSLAIDPSDNKPVAGRVGVPIHGVTGAFINISKWSSGTSWTYLGSLRTKEYSGTIAMAISPSDNELVVLYEDEEFGKLRVRKGSL
jgi:hypothetical protein